MATAGQLNALIAGNPAAPAIVFLHGFLGAGDDWDEIARDLVQDFYCVALDLPGHGASVGLADKRSYAFAGAAASVAKALQALHVERAVLVGYSLGGRLALQLAVNDPRRWRGLVLESASPGLASDAERTARAAADEEWAARLTTQPLETFLEAWYGQELFALRAPEEHTVRAMLARRRQNDPEELVAALRGMGVGHQPSLWEALPTLTVPALFLAGEFDLKYVATSDRMQRLCPCALRAIVSSAGHNIHVDNGEGFLRNVRGFLLSLRDG